MSETQDAIDAGSKIKDLEHQIDKLLAEIDQLKGRPTWLSVVVVVALALGLGFWRGTTSQTPTTQSATAR